MCKNVALEAGPLAGLQQLVHDKAPGAGFQRLGASPRVLY